MEMDCREETGDFLGTGPPLMHLHSKRRVWRRLAVTFLGGVIVGTFWLFETANETRAAAAPTRNLAPVQPGQPQPRVLAVDLPMTARSPAAASKPAQAIPVEAAPEAVRAAFPSIERRIADWREFRPEQITVAPHPDLPVAFTRTVLREEGPYVTWVGRNAQMPGASFVGVATAAGYDAVVVLPGAGQFSYHVRGRQVVVVETNPGDEACGNSAGLPQKVQNPEAGMVLLGITHAPGYEPLPDAYAEAAPNRVDVLVAYDAETLAAATQKSSDPAGYIDAQYKAMVETSNLALSQSGVTEFSWRYLGSVPAPAYTRTGRTLDDVRTLIPGGARGEWVATQRYLRGADQLVLLVAGETDFGGRAYTEKQKAVTNERAVSVVRWGTSFQILAHELAHNFGCAHDRAHVNVIAPGEYGDPAPDSDGFWNYGQLWENPVSGGGTAGTIMSYANWGIPYFSNPNISVQVTGAQFGWSWNPNLGTHRIGRPETDPKAAYNARVLNEQAKTMSGFQEEIVAPAIIQQPQDVSIVRGRALSLGVTATGGGLSYQWQRNGTPLPGLHTSSYTKITEDADAGTYTVVVTNHAGSVTSASAMVTVTAPAPAPSFTNSSGGGGGAPSVWFTAALLLCVATRAVISRRPRP